MKHNSFLCFFLLSKLISMADPGIGIVMDSKGNLFYTDLSQVWMIQPDGKKTIAVPNVHTHELYINKSDELFGEHLWYDDTKKNPWAYYLWKRNADGAIVRVQDTTAGFADSISFVRDDAGNQYLIEKGIPSLFWKIATNRSRKQLATVSSNGIGRLHINTKGTLYFSNKADLYSIMPGDSLKLYIKDIGKEGLAGMIGQGAHVILSIWSDADENLYVATGNMVKQISKEKIVTVIYQSTGDWKPSGGLVAPNGDYWIMEFNSKNEVRVNKIINEQRKEDSKENSFTKFVIPVLITGVVLATFFLVRKKTT